MATDRVHALRQVILACARAGACRFPACTAASPTNFRSARSWRRACTIKTGQTHVQKFMPELLELILDGKIDTTFLISHRLDLEEAPEGYKIFKEQQNEYTKVVLKPRHTRH